MISSVARKRVCDFVKHELIQMIEKWSATYDSESFTGGKMRGDRGNSIESLVMKTIDTIAHETNTKLTSKKGSFDKKTLTLTLSDRTLTKEHQVDVHVYLNDRFVAVIECKAYLDSCYYTRACDDFKLFTKFGYDVKTAIFALEDSIDEKTKIFTDFETDHVCNDIFYMLDGKRSSSKPVYDKRYMKVPNDEKVARFVDYICGLLV